MTTQLRLRELGLTQHGLAVEGAKVRLSLLERQVDALRRFIAREDGTPKRRVGSASLTQSRVNRIVANVSKRFNARGPRFGFKKKDGGYYYPSDSTMVAIRQLSINQKMSPNQLAAHGMDAHVIGPLTRRRILTQQNGLVTLGKRGLEIAAAWQKTVGTRRGVDADEGLPIALPRDAKRKGGTEPPKRKMSAKARRNISKGMKKLYAEKRAASATEKVNGEV